MIIILLIMMYIVFGLSIFGLFYFMIKLNHRRITSPDEFIGLLNILSSQIKSELDTYDRDIFANKGTITNNNFDTYYRDLTTKVIKSISPDLVFELTKYYTEDTVYRFIGRTIRDYLVSKINGTM